MTELILFCVGIGTLGAGLIVLGIALRTIRRRPQPDPLPLFRHPLDADWFARHRPYEWTRDGAE